MKLNSLLIMAQSVADDYVKFGTYMRDSKYSKKFVEEYLTGEDLDKTFVKFAEDNAADFTLEDIATLSNIMTMLKNPVLKSFIMKYAETHKSKVGAAVPIPPSTSTIKAVSPVKVTTSTQVPTDLMDTSKDFKEFVACNGLKYYEHVPSHLVVKRNGGMYNAVGYRCADSNIISPLNPGKVELATKYGFKVIDELPDINFIGDLKADLLKRYVKIFDERTFSTLSVDKIYRIKGTTGTIQPSDISKSDRNNVYIAGSKALTTFRDQLKQNVTHPFDEERKKAFGSVCEDRIRKFNEFKATDTDVFILNSEVESRMVLLDVDVVRSKSKSIEDLLERNFDLPPCRIAIDHKGDFIMTAHCLYSIITVNYYMHPEFIHLSLSSDIPDSTVSLVRSKIKPSTSTRGLPSNFDTIMRGKLRNIQSRMMKYQKRGFVAWADGGIDAGVASVLHLDYYLSDFYPS